MSYSFDGHQGSESLVYFPPIFPGMREATETSEKDLNYLNQSFLKDQSTVYDSKKRKNSLEGHYGSSKKLRTPLPATTPDFAVSIPSVTPAQPLSQIPSDFNFIADDDFMDGASDFFDGEFLPDLNITKDEDIVQDASIPDEPDQKDTIAFNFDDDFGILGVGVLPSTEDSSKAATKNCIYSNTYSYWLDPFEPLLFENDFPIRGPTLNSIILNIRKLNKAQGGSLYRPSVTLSTGSSQAPVKSALSNHASKNGAADSLLQKKKKRSTNSSAVTAFVPPAANDTQTIDSTFKPISSSLQTKDQSSVVNRNAYSSVRCYAHRGLPSLRVHHYLQDIFDPSKNQILRSQNVLFNDQFSSVSAPSAIRKLAPDENTGDSARLLAKKQSELFGSESCALNDIDFGPFKVSLLPESLLKRKSDPIGVVSGIKLPMGVKMPKISGVLLANNLDQWGTREDEMLKYYVSKFGPNWHAISRALALNARYSGCFDTENIRNPLRTTSQCSERWLQLRDTYVSPYDDTCNNIYDKEGNSEMDSSYKTVMNELSAKGILVDATMIKEVRLNSRYEAGEKHNVATRLRNLKKAGAQRKVVPLTIPGYAAGENAPPLQIVQSHPSHSQSVQEAIASAARPSGIVPPRAEMWPLQFLDLTEKQQQEVEKKKLASAVAQSQASRQSMVARNLHPQPTLQQSALQQTTANSRAPARAAQPVSNSGQSTQITQGQTQATISRMPQQPSQMPPQLRPGAQLSHKTSGNASNSGSTR